MSPLFAAFRRRRPPPQTGDEQHDDNATPTAEIDEVTDQSLPSLVVGLGNPDKEYTNTRHNVGAWCIALLAQRHGAALQRHGRIERSMIRIAEREVHLARPHAYMNESGPPVAAEAQRLRLHRPQLLVVYDDLDLPTGHVRLRLTGGHGGNRGMRSVISALGGENIPRVRIGIDRPYDDGVPVRDPDRIADWVLSRPSRDERTLLNAAIERAADAIALAAFEGVEVAMRQLNSSTDMD